VFRGVLPRMLEKHLTLENKWFAAILGWRPLFLRLLSLFPSTSIAGSQLTDATRGGTAVAGRGYLDSDGWRLASSVLACRVIGNFGLPCWLTATGLRVSVTRLNWGMFGSCLSVFFKSSLGPPRDTMVRRFAGWSYWEGQG
jgi:hypothetical protein